MPATAFPCSSFAQRSLHIPVRVRVHRQYLAVLSLARALEAGDDEAAARWDEELQRTTTDHDILVDVPLPVVSPSMRTKVLGSVLIDLARSGWKVSVEDGQVYAAAPEWSAGAKGMSPGEVRAEKERARAAMAARVQEELESEGTRRFILRMEGGAPSVLSLLADGPRVAAALRERGAGAVQPVLCRAELDAGHDPQTGLLYADIFRYFRLFWSFPTTAPPGRSLSYLLRDEGQPGSPVCGLLSIASPVPKLSVRDSALGWTAAWLEAVVVALDFPVDAPEEHLRAVADAWRTSPEHGRGTLSILDDVAALLGFPGERTAQALSARLCGLRPLQRAQRADGARRRLLGDLRRELEDALRLISFDGLGYAQRASEITSRMAGHAYTRPADLLAMTTTSFYGVGSSQYERLSVRSDDGLEVRWRLLGHTRGNGTLHFSTRTSALLDALLSVETGRKLITSRFGEGPSERLRKLRDGLERIGIDAEQLLRHGMPRLVYLAELRPGATRLGSRDAQSPWRHAGPSWEAVVQAWRERWLASRLRGRPDVVEEVARFSPAGARLSNRLAGARWVSNPLVRAGAHRYHGPPCRPCSTCRRLRSRPAA